MSAFARVAVAAPWSASGEIGVGTTASPPSGSAQRVSRRLVAGCPRGRVRPPAALAPSPGASRRAGPASCRSFDPSVVGTLESVAWSAYYRREWVTFTRAAVLLARHTFALSWPATIRCSWLVLRANQLWAPFPDNDPDRARHAMERFYRIVKKLSGEPFDPATAAALEVQWWQVHRDNHHSVAPGGVGALATAIAQLYAHVYGVPTSSVLVAAEQRTLAMRCTDRWVSEGCEPDSPLIDRSRAALVRCYVALRAAVES